MGNRTVRYDKATDCPDADKHTPHPSGYLAHFEWAQEMKETHRQTRCPTCGFWTVWVPRAAGGDA